MASRAKKLSPEEIITAIKQLTPEEYETLEILADKELTKELLDRADEVEREFKENRLLSIEDLFSE